MFEVRVETNFSSAHHLLNYKGKCENMHGHNWKVEVTARGNSLDNSNILIDFKVLKKVVNEITFSLYYMDVTGTKFCYCFHFFFMLEPHGKVEIIYP